MTTKRKPKRYLVKAMWQGTAMKFWVEALNRKQAWHRAWGQVSRADGGDTCLSVEILEERA